jgi:hypothetical protein
MSMDAFSLIAEAQTARARSRSRIHVAASRVLAALGAAAARFSRAMEETNRRRAQLYLSQRAELFDDFPRDGNGG